MRPACTSAQAGISVPVSSSTSVSSLNSAMVNCSSANPNGSYLLLGSGTFNISSDLIMYGMNNLTLRGSGPMSTILNVSSGHWVHIGGGSSGGSGALASNYSAGTTSITINSVSGPAPHAGQIAWLNQCDTGSAAQPCSAAPSDNGSIFVCGDYNGCQTGSDTASSYEHQYQMVWLTSVTNNGGGSYTVAISPGIYMPNWTTASGATLTWTAGTYDVTGMGLEDMTIQASGGVSSGNYLVQVSNAYASWVKGVRFLGSGANTALGFDVNGLNNLIANNYFAADYIAGSGYHAGFFLGSNTDSLVLNNISAMGLTSEYRGANVGDVTAYNYGRDGFTMYGFNLWSFDHHAFSSLMLYEGNENGEMDEDDTWGTHALNTYFRNNIACYDAPYAGGTPNSRGLVVGPYHRFENVIGNVVGTLSQCGSYQGTGYGTAFEIDTTDPLVASTLMRWGNVTPVQQASDTPANSGVRFVSSEVPTSPSSLNTTWQNPVPGSTSLPASFFMDATSHTSGGTNLSWWKVCTAWTTFPTSCSSSKTQPFPSAGPDLSGGGYVNGHAYDIPAAIAWLNLPIDKTLQNSYTITGSSWSGGTETLTVSGLPNTTHLMGAFQLSGVNSACSTGGTIGPNREILITNSSSSTISYALASNPGASCTGTMLFPDVRQFDERVYQNDSGQGGSSSNQPSAPGGLTAVVQ